MPCTYLACNSLTSRGDRKNLQASVPCHWSNWPRCLFYVIITLISFDKWSADQVIKFPRSDSKCSVLLYWTGWTCFITVLFCSYREQPLICRSTVAPSRISFILKCNKTPPGYKLPPWHCIVIPVMLHVVIEILSNISILLYTLVIETHNGKDDPAILQI